MDIVAASVSVAMVTLQSCSRDCTNRITVFVYSSLTNEGSLTVCEDNLKSHEYHMTVSHEYHMIKA